jgi:hypothetical protein
MESMKDLYGRHMAFISMCETRWNSMQGCFASLLRVKGALMQFYFTYARMPKFPAKFRLLGKNKFWERLAKVERIIRPLADLSYRL